MTNLFQKFQKYYLNPDPIRRHPRVKRFRGKALWNWVYPSFRIGSLCACRTKTKTLDSAEHRYIVQYAAHENEGIGGQFIKYNTTYILAKRYDLQFVDVGFTKSIHTPEINWNTHLGFHADELLYADLDSEKILFVGVPPLWISGNHIKCLDYTVQEEQLLYMLKKYKNNTTVCCVLGSPSVCEDQEETAEILRKKYWNSKEVQKTPTLCPTKLFKIVFHIRRGDALKTGDEYRKTPLSYYEGVAFDIAQRLKGKPYIVHTQTDGHIDEKSPLRMLKGFKVYENIDARIALHDIVTADWVVHGGSSFAQMGTILSQALVTVSPHFVKHSPFGQHNKQAGMRCVVNWNMIEHMVCKRV